MSIPVTNGVPENHPIRLLFRELAQRGLGQSQIHDEASVQYISAMMIDFIDTEAVYPLRDANDVRLEYLTDLIAEANKAMEPELRRRHFKHLGDLTLFMLGLFPERFRRTRRAFSRELYVAEGRRSYRIVAELGRAGADPTVFRRLADQYEHYVEGLQWVRLYIRDPFFQYMFREFGVT